MNNEIKNKIVKMLRYALSIAGLYVMFRLTYYVISSFNTQKITISLFVPDYDIRYLVAFAVLLTFALFMLLVNRWLKVTVSLIGLIVALSLTYLYIKTNPTRMQSSYVQMGKESLVIYTNPDSDQYKGKYKGFLHTTKFFGTKRDSADYIILETPVEYLNRYSDKQLRIKVN